MRGLAPRRSMATNAAMSRTPAANGPNTLTDSHPDCCDRVTPGTTASNPSVTVEAPAMSRCAPERSAASRSTAYRPRTTSSAAAAAGISSVRRQPVLAKAPPTTSPSVKPAAPAEVNTPSDLARAWGSVNRASRMARAAGAVKPRPHP